MRDFIGSIALLVCFAMIVIGPLLLPKLPPEDAEKPPGRLPPDV